jgi:hypothetical protein
MRSRRRPHASIDGTVIDLRDGRAPVVPTEWRITSRHRLPVSEESYWFEVGLRQAREAPSTPAPDAAISA